MSKKSFMKRSLDLIFKAFECIVIFSDLELKENIKY